MSGVCGPVGVLTLQALGAGRYRGHSVAGQSQVLGGQLIGQALVAASAYRPGARVRQIQAVFPRSGRTDRPLELAVQILRAGSTTVSATVAIRQGDRLICRATVLLEVAGPDTAEGHPGALADSTVAGPDAELRMVDAVDLGTGTVAGAGELAVWIRWSGLADDPAQHCGVVAWYTEPFSVPAPTRSPEAPAAVVVSHAITFHQPFRADEWQLLTHRVAHVGAGRSIITGEVRSLPGHLVASFTQESMLRRSAEAR